MISPRPAVFDCNVLLQAMLNARGAAGECWARVVAGEASLFVSEFIIAELRSLPLHPDLKRFQQLTTERVERFIEEVLDLATYVASPTPTFAYSRDPDDANYVNLALQTNAMLVVSNDRDLLDLMNDRNPDGAGLRKQRPDFQVLTPPQFLRIFAEQDRE